MIPFPNPYVSGSIEALSAAGFSPNHTPDGIITTDDVSAQALLDAYAGSPAELAYWQAQWLANLAALFLSKLSADMIYDGAAYQIDANSVQNITAMGALAGQALSNTPGAAPWNPNFGWITSANTIAPMTAAQMLGFAQAAAGHVSAIIFNNRTLKDAIAAATSAAQVQAVDLTQGWP